MTKQKTMSLHPETYNEIDNLADYRRESFDSILHRLAEHYKKCGCKEVKKEKVKKEESAQ